MKANTEAGVAGLCPPLPNLPCHHNTDARSAPGTSRSISEAEPHDFSGAGTAPHSGRNRICAPPPGQSTLHGTSSNGRCGMYGPM
jgi:hypothetical protein